MVPAGSRFANPWLGRLSRLWFSARMRFWTCFISVLAIAGCGHSGGKSGPTPKCGDGIVQTGEQCDDGNQKAGDGCENDCTKTPTPGQSTGPVVTECARATETPFSDAVCHVTAGNTAQLITGTVLLPGKILHGGQVLVDSTGVITCSACDCSTAAAASGATTIDCPTGVISPGLINAHDHITYTQNSPAADTGERYEQRHDWREGLRGHTKITTKGSATTANMQWGELRFMMGGATAMIGSGGVAGFLRNLDEAAAESNFTSRTPVDNNTFPLGDSAGTQLTSGCAYPSLPVVFNVDEDKSYQGHVSEGIDAVARNEFLCLSGAMGGETITMPQTSMVHAVALTPSDYKIMAQTGTAMVWSPRSNTRLYGNTATVTVAARLGVQIALGTDWSASGSINLQREIACADSWNKTYYGNYFTDEDLWLMVTRNAAASAHFDDVIGTLDVGKQADLAIFDGTTNKDHRAVLDAQPQDLVLVERGGTALYGDAGVVNALATGCDALSVCSANKALCAMGDIKTTYAALQAANSGIYANFFCGVPDNEPSCTPARPMSVNMSTIYTGMPSATDSDGDGVDNATDNCPMVFNPIRPLDNNVQADADGDGIGDACDACPLDAAAMTCAKVDPNDLDADGIPNTSDNCVTIANPKQEDGDSDGKGDACDACPAIPNMGTLACPASIYAIKSDPTLINTVVGLSNALVTGVQLTGTGSTQHVAAYFVQVSPSDAGYNGAANSGLYVYGALDASVKLVPGNRVDVNPAQVTNFHGEIELQYGTTTVLNPGNPETTLPAPQVVAADDVTTGGAMAAGLEGVLVQLANVSVTDVAPAPAGGDTAPTNEFVVGTSLRVDDLLATTLPLPVVGVNYTTLTGILAFRNANSKLEPRTADDYVLGVPVLTGLGPNSFTRVGYSALPTIPATAPLTVQLSGLAPNDTDVALISSDPTSLTVPATVTVLKGQSSIVVPVTGVARAAAVTVTATLASTSKTATVQVLDDGTIDVPVLTGLSPKTSHIAGFGDAATLTLTFSLPMGAAPPAVNLLSANGWALSALTATPDTTTATFTVTQPGATGTTNDTVTAALATVTLTASVSIYSGLVVNEVDYNQPGTDTAEFIEIYNPGLLSADLSTFSVVLVNATKEYKRFALTGSLGPKSYLVIGTATVPVPTGVTKILFSAAQDNITNGTDVGAIVILDTSTNTIVDSLAWGKGGVPAATITGITGTVNLNEGTPPGLIDSASVAGSIIRNPNGQDTNDATADLKFTSTITPGAANIYTP
jgi:cysteine-rich repeat protein